MNDELEDRGCPLCGAPADEMCTTAAGKVRDDHSARIKDRRNRARAASVAAAKKARHAHL